MLALPLPLPKPRGHAVHAFAPRGGSVLGRVGAVQAASGPAGQGCAGWAKERGGELPAEGAETRNSVMVLR